MSSQRQELPDRLFDAYRQLREAERRILEHLANRRYISRNTHEQFEQELTFGQRLADRIAAFGGSWPFIIIFGAVLFVWIVLNSFLLTRIGKPFDPYPYILLNLVLSMLAALQAPVIMMSQNRQAIKDRLEAQHDYEVNLKAEMEISGLHQKLDALREQQWAELVSLQNEQIRLLTQLLEKQK